MSLLPPHAQTSKIPSLQNSPTEILFHAFSYIGHPSDLAHVDRACKTWHLVSRDNDLWKNLFLSWFQNPDGTPHHAIDKKTPKWRVHFKRYWNDRFERELRNASRSVQFVWVANLTIQKRALTATAIVTDCANEIHEMTRFSSDEIPRIYVTDPYHWYENRKCQLFIGDDAPNWKETIKSTVQILKQEFEARQKEQEEAEKAKGEAQDATSHSPSAEEEQKSTDKTPTASVHTPSSPVNTKAHNDDLIAKNLALKGFSARPDIQEMILSLDIHNDSQMQFSLDVVDIPDRTSTGDRVLLRLSERFPALIDVNQDWVLHARCNEDTFLDLLQDVVSLNILNRFVQDVIEKQKELVELQNTAFGQYNVSEFNTDCVSLDEAHSFFKSLLNLDSNVAQHIRTMNIGSIKVVNRNYFEEYKRDSTIDSILIPADFETEELLQSLEVTHRYQPVNSSQEEILDHSCQSFMKNVNFQVYKYHSVQKMRNPGVLSGKKRKLEEMLADSEDKENSAERAEKRQKLENEIQKLDEELSMDIPFSMERSEYYM